MYMYRHLLAILHYFFLSWDQQKQEIFIHQTLNVEINTFEKHLKFSLLFHEHQNCGVIFSDLQLIQYGFEI